MFVVTSSTSARSGSTAATWAQLRREGVSIGVIGREFGVTHQQVSRVTAPLGPFPRGHSSCGAGGGLDRSASPRPLDRARSAIGRCPEKLFLVCSSAPWRPGGKVKHV